MSAWVLAHISTYFNHKLNTSITLANCPPLSFYILSSHIFLNTLVASCRLCSVVEVSVLVLDFWWWFTDDLLLMGWSCWCTPVFAFFDIYWWWSQCADRLGYISLTLHILTQYPKVGNLHHIKGCGLWTGVRDRRDWTPSHYWISKSYMARAIPSHRSTKSLRVLLAIEYLINLTSLVTNGCLLSSTSVYIHHDWNGIVYCILQQGCMLTTCLAWHCWLLYCCRWSSSTMF